MSTTEDSPKITLPYKKCHDQDVLMDIYPPAKNAIDNPERVPAVVFFHGGGLTVGDRTSWFPTWLKERVTNAGFAFISPDYSLLLPSNGHAIVEDIKTLFQYISTDMNSALESYHTKDSEDGSPIPHFRVDPEALAVAGASAGGLCAYLACAHAYPKPKALIALYAMGGDFLLPHYFAPKTEPFFRGRELLDPQDFHEYLYPQSGEIEHLTGSPLRYHGPDHEHPGLPANPRMFLARLYLQLGEYLDYYTGGHEPSLSLTLRQAAQGLPVNGAAETAVALRTYIPFEDLPLFPQFAVNHAWPPAMLIHGSNDTAVTCAESENMDRILQEAGVESTLKIIEGAEHNLDLDPLTNQSLAEEGGLFDEVKDFLVQHLSSPAQDAS